MLSPVIRNISLAVTLQFSREKYIAIYGKQENQAKIIWPEEGKIFRLKNYDRHNKSLLCLQSDAAKVSCRAQLLAHCACLYLGSSPSLEWQRQAGFWCHYSLVVMDAN